MKKVFLILSIIFLVFLTSCIVDKEYNDVTYQKNHDYYYINNEQFFKQYYHYDLYPNYQFKKK